MDIIELSETRLIYSTPMPEVNGYQEISLDNIDKRFQKHIEYFHTILKETVLPDCLGLFYSRISDLNIIHNRLKSAINTFLCTGISGEYELNENEIFLYVNKGQRKVLNHELLHLASTYVNKEMHHYQCGFHQENQTTSVGKALNEGYTEHLTNYLFNSKNKSDAYMYEMIISKLVEEIVESQVMQRLYFSGDLYNLINILNKYTTLDNIKKLLYFSDYFLDNSGSLTKRKANIESINYINTILLETYTNKMIESYQNGVITLLELYQNIEIFICKMKVLLDINLPMSKDCLSKGIVKSKQIVMNNIRKTL